MDHVMTGIGGPLEPAEDPIPAADPHDLGAGTGFVIPRHGFGVQGGIGRDADSWYMLAHGSMNARAGNRVILDARRTDRWGVPPAHITCVHAPEEDALVSEQLAALRELAAGDGLRVRASPSRRPLEALAFRLTRGRILLPTGAFVPGSAAHEIGGAGMGDDPRVSVTDRWGRPWDTENLIVADGACFPAGCWQNVTLTIMALARRAARRVIADGGSS
jgi:choline dehydrogenase-like flavoprotein